MRRETSIPINGRGRRGTALVELTISLTFLTLLFLGVWQFGYAFYIYNALEQAVRDGARYASLQKYDSASATPSSAFLTNVQNVVVYGTPAPAPSANPVAPGLATSNVTVTPTFSLGVPVAVTVAINNYKMPAFFGNLTLTNKPATWFPYVGIFGPP